MCRPTVEIVELGELVGGEIQYLVVSEKSIVLSWAVLEWSCSPTDMEMYPFRVVDQFPAR